jgi:regulator of protease activity HflC (stomatin/prohibitin superfamily)
MEKVGVVESVSNGKPFSLPKLPWWNRFMIILSSESLFAYPLLLSLACLLVLSAHVYDVMRSELPMLELDAVFEAKEELAVAVKNALSETMSAYGYQILQALITDLDPDQRVKNAMNEINSSKRLKFAVAERAEGDKILQVKSAEAEAEAKYLSGVGVAKQRKAIVDGLKSSIVDFSNNVSGSSTKEVMDLLLLTQYFDMIRDVGSANHCRTTMVPTSRTMGDDIRNSLLQADAAAK